MESLGKYILTVTSASILFGILQSLLSKKGSSAALLRLTGGLFLTFTVITPIADVDVGALFDVPQDFAEQGSAITAQGQQIAQDELQRIIKQRCEAYILDKAETYQAQLEVEVTLSSDEIPIPSSVQLKGSISPYAKNGLAQWLLDHMGITKENQIWIGS